MDVVDAVDAGGRTGMALAIATAVQCGERGFRRVLVVAMGGEVGVYIHVPFCVHKCGYCDFVSYAGVGGRAPDYVRAVCAEIERSPDRGTEAATVYFGGGTPTFLDAQALATVLETVHRVFRVAPCAEITLEANPTSIETAKLRALRSAGFNRVSIGVQAFDDRMLRSLERAHTMADALRAVPAARAAGFENVSIDLMFGLPGQSASDWDNTLSQALALCAEHLSLYALTVEEGTPFAEYAAAGRLARPDDDAEAAMFERAIERLTAAGYEHYEISNFALPERRARHNVTYWHNRDYLGFGPGAASYRGGRRWLNEAGLERYITAALAGEPVAGDGEELAPEAAVGETLMLGLRMLEGVDTDAIQRRFGVDPLEYYAEEIARLVARGLLVKDKRRLRLTPLGVRLANDVFVEMLPKERGDKS